MQIYRLVVVQIEAAEAAAKEAEKAKKGKKKVGGSRGGRQSGSRGGQRTRGSSSSSYSKRENIARRGDTMRSGRSRDRHEREGCRHSYRERDNYHRNNYYNEDKLVSGTLRSSRSQGGNTTGIVW